MHSREDYTAGWDGPKKPHRSRMRCGRPCFTLAHPVATGTRSCVSWRNPESAPVPRIKKRHQGMRASSWRPAVFWEGSDCDAFWAERREHAGGESRLRWRIRNKWAPEDRQETDAGHL